MIHSQLTPKMRLRQAFFKVLHLIRLRKLWSQCGALLQISGRRSFFLRVLDMIRICPRRSHRQWTLRQCWSYLGPIVRRHAAAFRHLHSRFGHLQYRSRPMERNFRRIVMAQIDANGWSICIWHQGLHRATKPENCEAQTCFHALLP